MRQKKYPVTNIGTSLILAVFIILALVTFAVLSIINTNHDYEFTKKIAGRTSMYYEASNTAQDILSQIDAAAKNCEASDTASYYSQVKDSLEEIDGLQAAAQADGLNVSYTVPVGDSQALEVEVTITLPAAPSGTFYTVHRWQEVPSDSWEGESKLNLLQ